MIFFLFKKAQPIKRLTIHCLLSPVTLISAYLSDRYESRGITIVLISLLGIAGFALYLGKLVSPVLGIISFLILGTI